MISRLRKRILEDFEKTFRCYADADGVSGGAGDNGAGDGVALPAGLEDDPDMKEFLEGLQTRNNSAGGDDGAAGDGNKDGAGDGDDSAAGNKDGDGAGADGKDSGDGENGSGDGDDALKTYEFEGDIAVGDVTFTKDTLNSLPAEVVENIGQLKQSIDTLKADVATANNQRDGLMQDPIIKHRADMIRSGKANELYSTGMTNDAVKNISEALKKFDLDESEINSFIKDVLVKEFNADLEYSARLATNNALLSFKNEQEAQKTNEEGKATIERIAKMNDSLTPEMIRQWCVSPERGGSGENGGMTYSDLVKFAKGYGDEVLYAAIAKKYNLPAIINAADHNSKIRKDERAKLIEALGGKVVADKLSKEKTPTARSGKKASIVDDGVIDEKRINDPEYIADILDKATDDTALFAAQRLLLDKANSVRQ